MRLYLCACFKNLFIINLNKMKKGILVLSALCTLAISAQEKKKKEVTLDSIQKLDEVIISTTAIFGNKYVAKNRTGSAYYLSPKELQKFGNSLGDR